MGRGDLPTVPPVEADEATIGGHAWILFGGIGLGIYFRSFVDFIAPIAIAIVVSLVAIKLVGTGAGLGWLAGAIIASLYGFTRSQDANKRLDEVAAAAPTTPASVKPKPS